MFVTCEFFKVYESVRPLLGRTPHDCASRASVVVISDVVWRDAMGASPDAVGRVIRINGQPLRIVGVCPALQWAGE